MSTNVSVRRRLFTLIFILAVCAWIPGCQLRIWSGWVPVSALPEWRNMYRPRQSFQVLLSTRNPGYEAQQLSECYKSEFSFLTTGFMMQSLKGMHYFLWRMFPKRAESLEIHIFSLQINAPFFFFSSLIPFFSLKGIGHDIVLWECMIHLWQWEWTRLPLRSLPILSALM